MNPLSIKVAYQIQKPVDVVYEAIVNPEHMTGYFISYGSGRMEKGVELVWRFPEFEGDSTIKVGDVAENESVTFHWEIDGKELTVQMTLTPMVNHSTLVTITEKEMEADDAGIQWLKGNTEGWTNFLCCLKAYLEYGINLRKGGFDFLIKKD